MTLTQISTYLLESLFNPPSKNNLYGELIWIKNTVSSHGFNIQKTLNTIEQEKGCVEYDYWLTRSTNKENLPKNLYIKAKKSRAPGGGLSTKTSFINHMIPENIQGFGLGKKNKTLLFLDRLFERAKEIQKSGNASAIVDAIKNKHISYKDVGLFTGHNGFEFKTKYRKIELAGLVLEKKYRNVLICFLHGLNNKETGKKTKLTTERVRQIGNGLFKNKTFLKAVKYYESETGLFEKKHEDEREVFVSSKDVKRSTTGLQNKKVGPPKKHFINQITDIFYNKEHVYFDVYKDQPQNIKSTFRYLIKSFYLKKDLFLVFEVELKRFYYTVFQKDKPIEKTDYSLGFLSLLEKHKEKIFHPKTLHFSKDYIYINSKVSVPFLVELAINKSTKPTKTLRIKEIHKWITTSFPQKKITSIEGVRGALLKSRNIITFGKTGNYGLAKDYGVKKSSDLSTKNLIIEILKKNENPVTEDVIENYVMNKNPFLKERGVPMIIEINPKTFKKIPFTGGNTGNKGIGRSYIGLVDRKYPDQPKNFSSKELKEYLNSKDLRQEWLSLSYIKKNLDIPEFQLKDFLLRKNYLIHENMITLSTPNPATNALIIKLVNNQSLIKQVGSYLDMNITEKTSFKKRMIEIIEKEYSIRLKNNHISKIINFIV